MSFHVDSETGRLRQVILHRPGIELSRLTPDNVDSLLFDDILWAKRAREEHDAFASVLRERGITVHYFGDLLGEVLEDPKSRDWVLERVINDDTVGPNLADPLRRLAEQAESARLSELLIGGVLKSELAGFTVNSLRWELMNADDFVLTPLPNHLFQRDNSAWIYGAVSVNPMAKEARQRETINSRLIYNFHPMFRSAPPTFLYGNDSAVHVPATVEGGDVAVLGHHTVMIGMGERTTPQGVELLSQRLFETGVAERVIVVELPKQRAFMHLDTALTQVDRDAYSVYPFLPDTLRSWHVTPERGGLAFHENDDLFHELAYALQVDTVRALKVPMDRRAAEREQWDDGNNFLAVAPGVVLGYECNTTTNSYLEEHGITVVPVIGSELGRGRGGPRCLSCPISRDA
jgi:arginine deiminase